MQDVALQDDYPESWAISNAPVRAEAILPAIQRLAGVAARDWWFQKRPHVHELFYIQRGRRVFRGLRWFDCVQMTHGGCVGRMKFGEATFVYLLVSDEGELYFSFEAPKDRKFDEGHPISDFERVIDPELRIAFLENVLDLLDEVVRRGSPVVR